MTTLAVPARNQNAPPTEQERADYDHNMGIARDALKDFMEVHAVIEAIPKPKALNYYNFGAAVGYIREHRLWRWEYASYPEFLREEFGLSETLANRNISAYRVSKSLPSDLPRPANESVTRPLRQLPEAERADAYREAAGAAGGSAPTASQVKEAVEKRRPPKGSAEEAKARGVIPGDVEVTVEGPTARDEPEPEPETEQTDAEWLATLPARGKIPAGFRRDRFDADALFHRRTEKARDAYQAACRSEAKACDKALSGHRPVYLGRHYGFLKLQAPEWWQSCGDCDGRGETLVGECPGCRGNGYHVH